MAAQTTVTAAALVVADTAGNQATASQSVILGTIGIDIAIPGTNEADFIFGFDGDDTITGSAGADVITVGAGENVIVQGVGASLATEAGADTITDFTAATAEFQVGVAADATAVTGNYVEVADNDYANNFANILVALNGAANTLAGTSEETTLIVVASDTDAAAGAGADPDTYVGIDRGSDGTIDEVIILTGIATNADISAADFTAAV